MSFEADILKAVQKLEGSLHSRVKRIVFDIGSGVSEKSPVGDPTYWKYPAPPGYVGGHFRANWQYQEGSYNDFQINGTERRIEDSLLAEIPDEAAGKVHYIFNNTPYAARIEDGHSWHQAPQGVVAVTLQEVSFSSGS